MEWFDTGGANITLSPSDIGPQTNGTYNIPANAMTVQPTDAGGGAAATYGDDILNLFKFGVGAWAQTQQNKDMLDYRRYEATQGVLTAQGQPSMQGVARNGNNMQGGSGPSLLMVALLAVAAYVVIKHV